MSTLKVNSIKNLSDVDTIAPLVAGSVPTGTIMPYVGSSAPAGWARCNGAAISRTTYAALFALTGTTYGPGDGSTTFGLPLVYRDTPWTAYTPTFTGYGTVSAQNFQYRMLGGDLQIRGRFTIGTPTAVEARISLPSGFTVASSIATLESVGYIAVSCAAASGRFVWNALIEPSVAYLTIGQRGTGRVDLSKITGNSDASSGDSFSIPTVTIPVLSVPSPTYDIIKL